MYLLVKYSVLRLLIFIEIQKLIMFIKTTCTLEQQSKQRLSRDSVH